MAHRRAPVRPLLPLQTTQPMKLSLHAHARTLKTVPSKLNTHLFTPAMARRPSLALADQASWCSTPAITGKPQLLNRAAFAPISPLNWEFVGKEAVKPQYRVNGQSGLALVELLLVVGIIAAATTAAVITYRVVDTNRKVADAIDSAVAVTENITASEAASGNFGGLTQAGAISQKIFPKNLLDTDGNPKNPWGGDILVVSTAIDGTADWGAQITYDKVPSSGCTGFVTGAANSYYEIKVNGRVVRTKFGKVNIGTLSSACNQENSTIQLIYAKNSGAGVYTALTPCTVPAPQTQVVACPVDSVGTVTQTRSFTCTSPYGNASALPWTEVSNTCAPACIAPPPTTEQGSQTTACATGRVTPAGASTFPQTRQRSISYSCPTGLTSLTPPDVNYGSWSSWTPTESAACATACIAGKVETNTETRNNSQSLSCPSGQLGSITQTRGEKRSQTRTSTCANPVAPQTFTPWGAWGSWEATSAWATTANTCAPACVVPTPSTQTNTENRTNTQTLACPSGQLGSITQQRPEQRTQSRSASCPAPTGNFTWSTWSTWSDWGATGGWTTTSNTCAPQCVAPAPTTQTQGSTPQSQTLACPYFQTGSYTNTRDVMISRSVSYSCPAPTGPFSTSYGNWYESGYGGWYQSANSCALPGCDGSVAGNARNYMSRYADLYNAFGTNYDAAYSHWINAGYHEGRGSCWGAPCTPPGNRYRWVAAADNNCPAGTAGTRYFEKLQYSTGYCTSPTGSQGYYENWTDAGQYQNYNTSQCTPTCVAPAPSVDVDDLYSNCPAGRLQRYGVRQRMVNWSCPGPTASYGGWLVTQAPKCCARACSIE